MLPLRASGVRQPFQALLSSSACRTRTIPCAQHTGHQQPRSRRRRPFGSALRAWSPCRTYCKKPGAVLSTWMNNTGLLICWKWMSRDVWLSTSELWHLRFHRDYSRVKTLYYPGSGY